MEITELREVEKRIVRFAEKHSSVREVYFRRFSQKDGSCREDYVFITVPKKQGNRVTKLDMDLAILVQKVSVSMVVMPLGSNYNKEHLGRGVARCLYTRSD